MKIDRLYVAEKPEAAAHLVAGICAALGCSVVNKSTARRDGYHELSNGHVVSNNLGHLLQWQGVSAFMTDEQRAKPRSQYMDFLPLKFPLDHDKWMVKPEMKEGKVVMRDGKPVPVRQFGVISKLLKAAKEIVNAGDIDREGQLIFDEILIYLGIDPCGRTKPIWRLPLVSNRTEDIAKQVLALSERNGDEKWVRLRNAALARTFCDFDVGMNLSMAWQSVMDYSRVSAGRVQSPVVAIVVDRERDIQAFKPVQYFVPVVTLTDGTQMRWHSRNDAAGQPGFDAEGRIVDERVAKRICDVIASGAKGRINLNDSKDIEKQVPQPFSSSDLYSTVAKRFGVSPKDAERAADALYNKHKAISYIGTDCRFLPQSYLDSARSTLAQLAKRFPRETSGANLELRSKAWNDAMVDEHHAIIPMGPIPPADIPPLEKGVFDTVVKRYVAQFYPSYKYRQSRVGAEFGGDNFRAVTQETLRMGWREVEGDAAMAGRDADELAEGDELLEADRGAGRDVSRKGG